MQSAQARVGSEAAGSDSATAQHPSSQKTRKRKGQRAGKKKKRERRMSFAAPLDEMTDDANHPEGLDSPHPPNFYSVRDSNLNNLSNTSIDSEVLLDHRCGCLYSIQSLTDIRRIPTDLYCPRDQPPSLRARRPSNVPQPASFQQHQTPQPTSRLRTVYNGEDSDDDDETARLDEGAPLLSDSVRLRSDPVLMQFGGYGSNNPRPGSGSHSRRDSSRTSSKRKLPNQFMPGGSNYNVNYPPSVPGTPPMRPSHRMAMSLGDVMLRDELELDRHSDEECLPGIDITDAGPGQGFQPPLERRHTISMEAEEDVCFPHEGLSEMADDDLRVQDPTAYHMRARRRRKKWPDLSILDEWSKFEKEGQSEERRAKKITEPQLVNGRLRPVHKGWSQTTEVSPYRFTYFNEQFPSTIHSQSISELIRPGGSFRELFIPDPPILSDSEEDDEDEEEDHAATLRQVLTGQNSEAKGPIKQPSVATTTESHSGSHKQSTISPSSDGETAPASKHNSGEHSQAEPRWPEFHTPEYHTETKTPRYGERPVWWLDILSPTEAEMKVISKAFGIHPLTSEDIMVQEPREKVELFRNYYFVTYRTFEQDRNSQDFLEPVNMYVVVFREGLLSFHFSMTPHPANVRRRVRQLRDYLMISSDWISYAIIDDITDVFVPLIQDIEEEVDDIDDTVLQLPSSDRASKEKSKKENEKSDATSRDREGDMLRRVGDCRKKVMSLYRLLSNKADVIKGFAKRCNAHLEVAPRSEIGLYLGDIQDHIVTMTGNLSHYEK